MTELHLEVGIVVARRKLNSPWAEFAWSPIAVLAAAPQLDRGVSVSHGDGHEIFFAGAATLTLHSSDTSHYRDNLQAAQSSVWVALTPDESLPEVCCVTADPYEGEALAEVYAERLEALSMPLAVREAVEKFVAENHVEKPFVKRERR